MMLFMGLSFSAGASAGWVKTGYESENIELTTGTKPLMHGGGDFVFVRFKNDAAFGVLYGTDQYPNSIVIVAVHARYLGGASAYDENGALVAQRVPIMVFTMFAQKLEDIFEFNDTNGDGIATYRKSGDGLSYHDYIQHEPIYKMVSLETAWSRSEVTELSDPKDDMRSWEFSLTATSLPYKAVGISDTINDSVENDVLEKLEFTFHLDASLVSIDNQSVPYYRVTVEKDAHRMYSVVDSERVDDVIVSGKRGLYNVKYDHLIEGWDFDPTNQNEMLVLENHVLIGNVIPEKVAEWIRVQFIDKINGAGRAEYETADGMEEVDDDDAAEEHEPVDGLPRKLNHNYVRLKDNWESIGDLTWISNVTVDGVEKNMYAQVQGHKRIAVRGEEGNWFVGFALLAGFSYPGGDSIYHDPSVSSEAMIEMSMSPLGTFPAGLVMFLLIAAVAVLTGIAVTLYTVNKNKKEQYFRDSFDTYDPGAEDIPGETENWERYYGKR
jgi:hypothetical protein